MLTLACNFRLQLSLWSCHWLLRCWQITALDVLSAVLLPLVFLFLLALQGSDLLLSGLRLLLRYFCGCLLLKPLILLRHLCRQRSVPSWSWHLCFSSSLRGFFLFITLLCRFGFLIFRVVSCCCCCSVSIWSRCYCCCSFVCCRIFCCGFFCRGFFCCTLFFFVFQCCCRCCIVATDGNPFFFQELLTCARFCGWNVLCVLISGFCCSCIRGSLSQVFFLLLLLRHSFLCLLLGLFHCSLCRNFLRLAWLLLLFPRIFRTPCHVSIQQNLLLLHFEHAF
mmetsp:Transcript_471/g.949  ORF Transcript_471/g.949 Transcript_471/m.949 type:complete len:279 (+) Transcript_471:1299-2135(+)